MQTLVLGQTNRVYLNTQKLVSNGLLTIRDATGSAVLDGSGNPLTDKDTSLDVPTNRHYYDVTFDASTVKGDIYLYWSGTTSGIDVVLESEFTPEDGVIEEQYSTDIQLVSPSYVMDHFLRGISEAQISSTFQCNYRDVLRQKIQASTAHLEEKIDLYFTPHTITEERHDFVIRPILDKYWTCVLYHSPIIEITEFKLKLNENEIALIPDEWIQVGNKDEGRVKVMPFSRSGVGLIVQITTGLALGLHYGQGDKAYVPDFFEYSYTAGLEWDELDSSVKEDIKNAIARHVALEMLPNLDVNRGLSSEAKSIDGASSTKSYTSSATFGEHSAAIMEYRKQHIAWIALMKKKYMRILQLEGFG